MNKTDKTPLKGKLVLNNSEKGAAALCFEENDTRRTIRLCAHDHLVIRNPQGEVVFAGRTAIDYSTNATILNAQHGGQLFPWPAATGYQGYAFIHGAPKDIPADIWLTAVCRRWEWAVELTPCPALLADAPDDGTLKVSGVLDPFFETGTEGVIWSVYDPRKGGYDGLNCLKDGDHLTVFEPDGETVRWQGVVKLEYKRRFRPYPANPQYGQQEVLGFWVHGLQEGLAPTVWAKMFFDRLPCLLVTKPKK